MTKKFKRVPKEEQATRECHFRVTQATYLEIKTRADSHNLTLTEYIIRTTMARPINRPITFKIINELLSFRRLIVELHHNNNRDDEQYLVLMQAICDSIREIPIRLLKQI